MGVPVLAGAGRGGGPGGGGGGGGARLGGGGLGGAEDCDLQLYPLTENWTYRVDGGSGAPGVLRIYRPGGRSPAEIFSELAWMGALRAAAGALGPEGIPPGAGGRVLELARPAPADPCYCVMFSCAPGREPAEDELAAWFPRLGAITARVHRHARAWPRPSWFSRPRWDLATTLGDRPHWGPWQSSVSDAAELAQLERLARVVSGRLRGFGVGDGRFGLVHADLRLANLLVDGERITVIDFEDCGRGWDLYALACA